MPIRAEVHGSKALKAKLAKLGEAVTGTQMVRALTAGALLIQNEAKRRAPYETGNLRRSIHIGGAEDLNLEGRNIVDKGPERVPEPQIAGHTANVFVGTDVVYAAAQEFGTEHIAAQPYLRPAADTQEDAVQGEIAAALRDLIKAAV